MSKRNGDFRSKIDSILSEGADSDAAQDAGEGSSLDATLSGDQTVRLRRPAEGEADSLTRLVSPTTETKLDQIDIARVTVPSHHSLAPTNLEELAASISQRGILMPLLLRPSGNGYEVVDGGKRLIAARALGMLTVPAVVRELTDDEVAAAMAERTADTAAAVAAAEAAAEKAASEARVAAEARAVAEKAEAERVAAERAEAERVAAERAEAAERAAEEERVAEKATAAAKEGRGREGISKEGCCGEG